MESHRSIVCTYCLDDDRIGVCYRSCQFRVDDGMGTSITGLVIKESSLTYFPLLALVTAIYMFMTMPSLHTPMVWQLYFGGSFVVVMIVPGHILNAKCKKIC